MAASAAGYKPNLIGGSSYIIPWYSPLAILTALTLRAVFHLALRQTEGLIGPSSACSGSLWPSRTTPRLCGRPWRGNAFLRCHSILVFLRICSTFLKNCCLASEEDPVSRALMSGLLHGVCRWPSWVCACVSGTNLSSALEAQRGVRYCLNCLDHSLSHHAV